MDAQELRSLRPELDLFLDRYALLFGRPEAQGHARRAAERGRSAGRRAECATSG